MGDVQEIFNFIDTATENEELKNEKIVRKKNLINILNYINFQDGTLAIKLKYCKDNREISLPAKPKPCLGEQLDCLWAKKTHHHQQLESYQFQNLFIDYGQKRLIINAELISMNMEGISVLLPETCCEIISRQMTRHFCKGIKVQLIQNCALFHGSLLEFSTLSFRIEIAGVKPWTFQWINPEIPVYIILSNDIEILYSGECRILRQGSEQKMRTMVLEPLRNEIRRLKRKKYRSERQELIPSPNIIFRHPFTGKIIDLKVIDLSATGFAVDEKKDSSVLLPGMLTPELEISFANSYRIKCKAQVVYQRMYSEEDNRVKCGFAILDMDSRDHMGLLALLHQAKNPNSYLCNKVNLDALWNFFFETGFIYPEKYAFIQTNKEKIKTTYEKLYTLNPNIARHFIYQEKGCISGHMAMLRFYENSWLIHHFAANKSVSTKAGLAVLDQIGQFINDSHILYSLHMNFVFCYFRPENRFPARVFGGAAKNINDSKGCSIDTFAYLHKPKFFTTICELPESWQLTDIRTEDLLEIESYYKLVSGGLMIHALDLEPNLINVDEPSKEYHRIGLKKERHLFALKKDGRLKAVIIVNLSDIGLNMSELTNCIQVIVIDPDELNKDIINIIFSLINDKFEQIDMPMLLYPVDFAERQSIQYEKLYNLWILNLQYSDLYFKFCDTKLRIL